MAKGEEVTDERELENVTGAGRLGDVFSTVTIRGGEIMGRLGAIGRVSC